MEATDVKIRGFKLDYEDPDRKIVDNIDQIDIFALFDEQWTVIKKIAEKDDNVFLIRKDGSYVSFSKKDPANTEVLQALGEVTKAFKAHFEQYTPNT